MWLDVCNFPTYPKQQVSLTSHETCISLIFLVQCLCSDRYEEVLLKDFCAADSLEGRAKPSGNVYLAILSLILEPIFPFCLHCSGCSIQQWSPDSLPADLAKEKSGCDSWKGSGAKGGAKVP